MSEITRYSLGYRSPAEEEAEGEYVLYADHAAALRERDERIAKLEKAAQALVDAMETCHECKGTVLVEEQPVHCEDCSSDCDSHEGAECPTIYSLHLSLKQALEAK